uniref:non-specific serine/threonine protein kinase n=1 Tax=Romanomermis culicivorax TaxID=13658 RepID=A0A915KEQ8_ROMCU
MERYERVKLLGRGAHGIVYLCKRLLDNKLVVIKEIPVEMKTFDERQAALGEVKLLDLLDHPNIIGYDENFFDQNNLCIVMEYAEGGTLADLIAERRGLMFGEGQILRFFAQLCNALYHLHTKALHRDIKPQNILLDKTKSICKLSDFGISKILSTYTKASTVIGTPSYLSPEICEGKQYNKKSDVWSLGCILYELCTLRKAFEAETLGSLVLQITRGHTKPIDGKYSDGLKDLIAGLLRIDPESRPSVEQIRADPLVAPFLYDHIDIGAIRCPKLFKPSRTVKLRSSNRSRKQYSVNNADNPHHASTKSKNYSKVFVWGDSIDQFVQLPVLPSKSIIQVACSSTHKLAVTKDNDLLTWKEGVNENEPAKGISSLECQIIKFTSPVQITFVTCADMFYAMITDRGILMTCGNGIDGVLSLGVNSLSLKPRIVEALVSCEVTKVACSRNHVLVATADNELYGWGLLDNGRLGVPGNGISNQPQRLAIPEDLSIHSIYCTFDASAFVTDDGDLYYTGFSCCNKLASFGKNLKNINYIQHGFCKANLGSLKIDVDLKQPFSFSSTHAAFISNGQLFTFGSNDQNSLGPRSKGCDSHQPNLVNTDSLTSICAVYCGEGYTIIRTLDHRLYSFGRQGSQNLGREGLGKDIGLISLDNLTYDSVLSVALSNGFNMACVKS